MSLQSSQHCFSTVWAPMFGRQQAFEKSLLNTLVRVQAGYACVSGTSEQSTEIFMHSESNNNCPFCMYGGTIPLILRKVKLIWQAKLALWFTIWLPYCFREPSDSNMPVALSAAFGEICVIYIYIYVEILVSILSEQVFHVAIYKYIHIYLQRLLGYLIYPPLLERDKRSSFFLFFAPCHETERIDVFSYTGIGRYNHSWMEVDSTIPPFGFSHALYLP